MHARLEHIASSSTIAAGRTHTQTRWLIAIISHNISYVLYIIIIIMNSTVAIVSDNIVPTRIKYYIHFVGARVRRREQRARSTVARGVHVHCSRSARAAVVPVTACACACAFPSRPTSPSGRLSQPPVSIFKVSPAAAGSSTHSKAERAIIILYACAAAAAAEWLAEKGWLCTDLCACLWYYTIIMYRVCVCA